MQAAVLDDPAEATDLVDWGDIPTTLEGTSRTSDVLLHRGPDDESECGLWVYTPGCWACHASRDEFTHCLQGSCTDVHEDGAVVEIRPNSSAFFPKGWKGTCRVQQTVKKVYMIR